MSIIALFLCGASFAYVCACMLLPFTLICLSIFCYTLYFLLWSPSFHFLFSNCFFYEPVFQWVSTVYFNNVAERFVWKIYKVCFNLQVSQEFQSHSSSKCIKEQSKMFSVTSIFTIFRTFRHLSLPVSLPSSLRHPHLQTFYVFHRLMQCDKLQFFTNQKPCF